MIYFTDGIGAIKPDGRGLFQFLDEFPKEYAFVRGMRAIISPPKEN
ncbi:hypothetical protein SAMN05216243_0140 [Sediminibacillus albus]|uniref:Uncharacterized protein n=1 Tax=Sediminibacillus albus TaxID=407036 RepID=A0A1G8VJ95_9BACI|nr:hypothetical protein SAMN05216243_0140 [Sediminibacillus albus]